MNKQTNKFHCDLRHPTRKELKEMELQHKLDELEKGITTLEETNAKTEAMLVGAQDYLDARYVASIGGEGIIRSQDIPELKKGVQQVFEIMKDGNWYTIPRLRELIGQEGADRRMRELRQAGLVLEKRRVGESRLWEYRLALGEKQGFLFQTLPDKPATPRQN